MTNLSKKGNILPTAEVQFNNIIMLTSSASHYLRPEYLSPIQGNTIELDAKKSPLALLAQTCSQIGADLPQKNSALPSSDKAVAKGKSTPSEKSPSSVSLTSDDVKNSTSSFKPYEKKKEEEDEDRISPTVNKRSPPGGSRSPSDSLSDHPRTASRGSEGGKTPLNIHDLPTTSSELASSSSSGASARGSSPHASKTSIAPSHALSSLGDLSKDPLAAYKLTPGLYSPLGLGLDPLGAAGLSALTAKVPISCSAAASSLTSPYIGYARVKTPTGTETIIPVCRDPYCTGCQINTHALQVVNGVCPPGCSQCIQIAAHTKSLASLSSSLISSIPSIPTSSLSSLYAPPSLISGSPSPYVCNWIAGDTYCGKRFGSSEDLLQHLRTHTNLSTTEASSIALSPLHHHALLSAHHSLPRGYPTPPLSPLSAAARYHPYAKAALPHLQPTNPLTAVSALSLSALAPHPLSAYYNPYSLYARATVGLHP